MRVGLVLGAGGVVGQAYQAGALAALEHDLGWDARTADVLVGSSAGSITATLLRLGVPASDLAAWAVEAPLSGEGRPVLEEVRGEPTEIPPMHLRDLMRRWHWPSPALVARTLRRPWALRPAVLALTLMPTGKVNIEGQAEALAQATEGRPWPEGLLICTVRRSDGARVVFGRPGSPPATLAKAVTASCAIPGYFRPVSIGGVGQLGGGAHSSTNADVLRDQPLDLVIVVGSMSAAGGWSAMPHALLRPGVHRRLGRELSHLRRAGTTVVRIEPSPRALGAMGVNAMAAVRTDAVVREAFLDTGRRTAQPAIAARLAPLTERAARRGQGAAGDTRKG